ncbi:MAG: sulfhydrogenase subunit alpha [Ilumatobacter sp.]|jgi:sulfhydrogenase subunit alpha
MTHKNIDFRVPTLARVEGEGALHVAVEGGVITDLRLEIYEPPRFFESFLRGRGFAEPVDITSRVCGICPVAYQMSAATALEAIAGVEVGGVLRDLRRLMYAGEWIESHVLHIGFLHAPDFLGAASGIELAGRHPELIEKVLRLKKIGNEIIEVVGGRPIHPVNVRLGGFYRAPDREAIGALAEPLQWAHQAAIELVEWVSGFEFPDVRIDHEFVALRHPHEYAVMSGRLVSDRGLDIDIAEFDTEFTEHQVPHSTALHARRRKSTTPYLTGPLARWANNRDRVPAAVDAIARSLGVPDVERNPFRSIVIRSLEVLIAVTQAQEIVEAYVEPKSSFLPVVPTAGIGWGATEAPRGVLLHRYAVDDAATITDARIIPPTSQNQAAIEADVRRVVEQHLRDHSIDDETADHELQHLCETAVRNHDPCISCATHFLTIDIQRNESTAT